MAPLPSLAPSLWGAASPFTAALNSMKGTDQQQQAPSSPSQIQSAVFAAMNGSKKAVVPAAPAEAAIKMYSPEYYMTCALGGVVSCGATHTAVTPLDVVKCNIQTDPQKYKGIKSGFSVLLKEQGAAGLFRGWLPTLLGYSAQGAFKFGLYEFFKKTYADMAGEELVAKYQTIIFLAGSASAEFFADMALSPFEAVKVAVQTRPGFAKGLTDGMPKLIQAEGAGTLFKSLVPLWCRQIPYTMMKFAAFENTVQALYKYVVPKPRDQCSKSEQLTVSFAAGYIAGVFCAVVSHPADNLVSKLNAQKGSTAGDIIKQMGWPALFTRGLGLRIIMIGTLTGLQWGIYDAFKVAAGLPATGAKAAAK